MSPVNPNERLEHVLDAIQKIETFCKGKEVSDFLADELLQSAVLHQFLIIGEAVANLDTKLLSRYDYPWYFPRSFRNYIAHEYFGINLERVWQTVQIDLPELKKIITDIKLESTGP